METFNFFAAPLTLGLLLVAIHAYLGLHVLEREVIFVDIGLSQVAALGAAVSLFYVHEEDATLALGFSLGLCLLVAAVLSLLRRYEKKISQEALIGMTYALASGLMMLVADKLPHGAEHLKQALIGNILFVTWEQVAKTAGVYFVVGVLHWIFRRQFWDCSKGKNISVLWDFFFYLLFGIVITFSTHHAGVLLVFSILVAPAALSSRFFQTIGKRLFGAWGFGTFGILGAFYVSFKWDLPAGAAIVSVLTGAFFLALSSALVARI